MNAIVSKLAITGGLFLFTLLSGVWLSHSGRPLNVAIFTIHKLIALATVIAAGVTIYNLHKITEMRPIVEISAIIITGLLFLFLFITGALLSFDKPVSQAILAIHRITPFLAALSTAATLYLLASGRQFSQLF